jgi:thymidylate synthase (FAD)
MSARYTPLPDVSYIPSLASMLGDDAKNRQAGTIKEAGVFTEADYAEFVSDTYGLDELIQTYYDKWLKRGVRKEQARIRLPVGRYSRMRVSANLRNWMQFLALRDETHAQWEIRQYARVVRTILAENFPRTMALFAS